MDSNHDVIFLDCARAITAAVRMVQALRLRERERDLAEPGNSRRAFVIGMSPGISDDNRRMCVAAGIDDFIAKPVRPGERKRLLSQAGGGGE